MAYPASTGFLDLFYNPQPLTARELFSRSFAYARKFGTLPDPSFALGRDVNVYEVLRRDAAIDHAISLGMHAVAGSASVCVPGDGYDVDAAKRLADLGTKWIGRIDNIDDAKLNSATGVFLGSSFGVVKGKRERHDWVDGIPRDWWVCTAIKDVDRRRMEWRRPLNSPANAPHVLHYADIDNNGAWMPVEHPEWIVQYVHEDRESTFKSGRGLVDSLFIYLYAKTQLLQMKLRAAERWGEGFLVVKVDPNAPGSAGKDNATLVQDSINNVEASKSRHVVGCLTTEEIDNLGADPAGFQMILDAIRYVDDAILRLCMGSSMPFGGGGDKETGSNARATTESDVSDALMKVRRNGLESAYQRTLWPLFASLNRANLVSCGLATAAPWRLSFTKETQESPAAFAETVSKLLTAGVPLDAKWVYDRLGCPMPKDAPETLEGKPDPLAAGLPGMGAVDPTTGDPKPGGKPVDDAPPPGKPKRDAIPEGVPAGMDAS